jgi:A/G-specific adenine glycosylase
MKAIQKKIRDRQEDLLSWYDQHKRDLPWRHTTDPYAIWVSEVMLQQTRVETVLPYYETFLTRFPTVEALAGAEVEEVLGAWSGLGYYRRARLLHQAARQIIRDSGRVPKNMKELLELPGVGAYTAAAIGSMAFGLVEPAIDGNVERVISRHLGIDADPKRGEARRQVLAGAGSLIDEQRPGDSNQALMELGATLCRPRGPHCSRCPLGISCKARIEGNPEAFPAARSRPVPTRVRRQVAVVQEQGRVLLFRRPETSEILPGMWELPWVEGPDGARAEVRFADRYGGQWHLVESLGSVRHSITHRTFEIRVLAAQLSGTQVVAEGEEAGWFTPQDLENLAVSSLVKKVLALAAAGSSALAGRQ